MVRHCDPNRGDGPGPLVDTCGQMADPAARADPQVSRSIVSVQLMMRLATDHGLNVARGLAGSGISAATLMDPQAEIQPQQELKVIENLVAGLPGVPDLGLQAGLRYHLSLYGVWGFALATSPTLRELTDVATRYLDLSFAFIRFDIGLRDQRPTVDLQTDALPPAVRQFVLERDFAAMVNALTEVLPGASLFEAVDFSFAQPAYADAFRRLCGVTPRFGQPDNRVFLRPASLDQPLPQGNALVSRACEDYCRRLLARKREHVGLAARVRQRLLRDPQRMPGIEALAREFNMAPRSLRRRLDEEGTRFRDITEDVRQSLARDLLRNADLKLDEIAERLGYAEAASFIHAFRRWTGMTPSAFRAAPRPR